MSSQWTESRSRCAHLNRVFTPDNDPALFNALIARLCVLYEDLRIEVNGGAAAHIECLDILQPIKGNLPPYTGFYRVLYFLRRLTGTLCEFSETIRKLHCECAFQRTFDDMPNDLRKVWLDAVGYYEREEKFLKGVRNDVGGHFGIHAARYAVANIPANAVGRVEVETTMKGNAPKLCFAGEVAATAMLRHLPGSDTAEKVRSFYHGHILIASRHATNATHILTIEYLFPRFGVNSGNEYARCEQPAVKPRAGNKGPNSPISQCLFSLGSVATSTERARQRPGFESCSLAEADHPPFGTPRMHGGIRPRHDAPKATKSYAAIPGPPSPSDRSNCSGRADFRVMTGAFWCIVSCDGKPGTRRNVGERHCCLEQVAKVSLNSPRLNGCPRYRSKFDKSLRV